eukprot:CCRYP_016007-RC/>CCRYP_016007-RC protein AED:0.07 eAED:0.07 QI:85/1/1/1/1/1/4/164/1225
MSRENSKLSSLSNPRSQPQHRSRNSVSGGGDDDDDSAYAIRNPARNQLYLDLDVKRVRPIIEQYELTRPTVKSSKGNQISPPAEEIVPSLGLHMLQTGSQPGNNGTVEPQAPISGNVSRPTQKQPTGDYIQSMSSSETVDKKEECKGGSLRLAEQSKDKTETIPTIGKATTSNKVAKCLIILILLTLQLLLIYSVYINSSSDHAEGKSHKTSPLLFGEHLQMISSLGQYATSFFASVVDTQKKSFPLDQLKKRLHLGQSLINELNDPLGAHVACSSVTSVVIHHFHEKGKGQSAYHNDSLSSSIFSCLPFLNEEESRLLADALLCMGEAKLALLQPSNISSLALRKAEAKKVELVGAKEAFEASISVDPTNAASRAGLGLTFLLLGTVDDSSGSGIESDENVQYLIQSIQNLKVAIGWSAESNIEQIVMIHLAAIHNLGLAYLALDSVRSSKESQYLEMVSSLQNPQHQHRIMDSSVLLGNEGAVLLQMGKVDEAMMSLETTALSLSCGTEDPLESDQISAAKETHQHEACLILQHNIDVAKSVVLGKERPGEDNDDMTAMRPSLNISARESTQSELLHDDVGPTSNAVPFIESDETERMPTLETQNETSTEAENSEFTETSKTSSDDIIEIQPHDTQRTQLPTGDYLRASTESSSGSTWETAVASFTKKLNPELQNALVALEQAAKEGLQRPRLLLALAKARSSTGDVSGAINAALDAISVATSVEETEVLTSYLETLMSKLTGDSSDEALNSHAKQSSRSDVGELDNNKDHTVSELEMKLEIERLKYRVLEQEHKLQYHEMRLSGGQHPTDYGAIGRVIDYQRGNSHISSQTISSKNILPDESVDHDVRAEQIPVPEFVDVEQEQLDDSDDTKSIEVDSQEAKISSESLSSESNSSESISSENVYSESIERSEDESEDHPVQINSNEKDTENNQTVADLEIHDHQENLTVVEPISLPSLFSPPLKPPVEISATAKSYMKMADAYLDKGKYALASKQFLKVIRKAPDHLAAHLGYATALERAGKTRQLNDAAAAYGNATRIAVIQGDKIDPFAKAGAGGMAESILRRAVKIAQSASNGRLELLQALSKYAHTLAVAADVYHAIGTELIQQNMAQESNRIDALKAFSIANEFIIMRNDTEAPLHVPSILEMGRIALESESSPAKAIEYFEKAKKLHLEDDDHVKLLVLAGRAHSVSSSCCFLMMPCVRFTSQHISYFGNTGCWGI